MVAGINETRHMGNLTADPKFSQGDRPENDRLEFGIAVNELGGRDSEGREPPPLYLDVVFWGKSAEGYSQRLVKGSGVYVAGKIEVRTWEDRETQQPRKAWRIKAFVIRHLDSNRDAARDDRGRDDDRRAPRRDERRPAPRRAPADRDFRDEQGRTPPADRDREFDDLPF